MSAILSIIFVVSLLPLMWCPHKGTHGGPRNAEWFAGAMPSLRKSEKRTKDRHP